MMTMTATIDVGRRSVGADRTVSVPAGQASVVPSHRNSGAPAIAVRALVSNSAEPAAVDPKVPALADPVVPALVPEVPAPPDLVRKASKPASASSIASWTTCCGKSRPSAAKCRAGRNRRPGAVRAEARRLRASVPAVLNLPAQAPVAMVRVATALRNPTAIVAATTISPVAAEEEGRVEFAAELLRAAMAAGGPRAELCFQLAELLYRLGDVGAARERYYTAIELDEDFVEARNNLGCVLAEQGQGELAAAAFQGALACHPEYPDAHYHLARTLDETGREAEAEHHWRQFLKLSPDSPWADEARDRLGE